MVVFLKEKFMLYSCFWSLNLQVLCGSQAWKLAHMCAYVEKESISFGWGFFYDELNS